MIFGGFEKSTLGKLYSVVIFCYGILPVLSLIKQAHVFCVFWRSPERLKNSLSKKDRSSCFPEAIFLFYLVEHVLFYCLAVTTPTFYVFPVKYELEPAPCFASRPNHHAVISSRRLIREIIELDLNAKRFELGGSTGVKKSVMV